jgi:translation initiation factor IF-2
MATKTSSKTATRKQAARGTAAARKPAAAAKTKLPKQKLKEDVAPATKPRTAPSSRPAPETARSPGHEAESVSLIDRKKPSKKAEEGEVKPKRDVLPPISRIRASLETPAKPAPPTTSAPVEPVTVDARSITDAKAAPDVTEPPPAEEETAGQKIILIKPPIIVKQLATELGLKPHQLIAELMNYNIFANINQTIEPDVASKIAESHGFVLEKVRRE